VSEHVSRQHEVKIDGNDISRGIVSISMGFTPAQLEDCPEINTKIVLDRACGFSLWPTNPLWQEYANVTIQFAKLTGVLSPSPIGAKQRLQKARVTKWGKDKQPERLELTCVCEVGYSRDSSSFATVAPVVMPTGASVTDLLNAHWATKGITIDAIAGDVVLFRQTAFRINYPAKKLNTATHCHKIASHNPPVDGQFIFHIVDNLGRLRLIKSDLLSANIWRSYPVDGLDEPLELTQEVTEQLPGRIKARSLLTIFTPLPASETDFTQSDDIRQITTRSIDGDSEDELYEQDRVVYPEPPSNNPDETPEEKATRTSLTFSHNTFYSKQWDGLNRFVGSQKITYRPGKSIDPETSIGSLTTEIETITVTYGDRGVMSSRITKIQKVAGLTPDTENEKTTLIDYETKIEKWSPKGNGRYSYSSVTTNFVDKRLGKGGITISNSSNAQVPATEIKPDGIDKRPQELLADAIVAYHPDETLSGSIDVFGYGTYTGTLSYFSGTYKVTPTTGAIYQGEGQLYNVSGVIEGVGRFRGGGSWTGTRRPLRDDTFDGEAYPGDWISLKRTAQIKAILTYGRKFAYSGALRIDDAMFDNGGVRPGLQVRIGDDIYLMNSPTIEWGRKRFQLFGHFELIGRMVANVFTPAINFQQSGVGNGQFVIVDSAGTAILGG
jgi:hypothetical protein